MAVGLLDISLKSIGATMVLMALVLTSISCGVWARNSVFFGRTDPPARNILRYVTGDEPESLDPQISSGVRRANTRSCFGGLVLRLLAFRRFGFLARHFFGHPCELFGLLGDGLDVPAGMRRR